MKEIKFRAWHYEEGNTMYVPCMEYSNRLELFFKNVTNEPCSVEVMQYTGLKDKNGKEIYSDDLVNVFHTSNNGEHIHDGIYRARINDLYGIELHFEKLLWESHGYNQYPISSTLTSRYGSLDNDYHNSNYDKLAVKDTWGENSRSRTEWKCNDYSNYIEVIGNIYENPELLEGEE